MLNEYMKARKQPDWAVTVLWELTKGWGWGWGWGNLAGGPGPVGSVVESVFRTPWWAVGTSAAGGAG